MTQTHKTLLIFFLCASFTACSSIQFSEEEMKFMNKISSMLEGAQVQLTKGVTSNNEEGIYKKLEIIINEPNFDNTEIEVYTLFMKSVPALMLLKSKIPNVSDYKYVDITINSKRIGVSSVRYAMSELQQVEACLRPFDGYAYGLQHTNKDSLQYYSDPRLFKRFPLDSLASSLKKNRFHLWKTTRQEFSGL